MHRHGRHTHGGPDPQQLTLHVLVRLQQLVDPDAMHVGDAPARLPLPDLVGMATGGAPRRARMGHPPHEPEQAHQAQRQDQEEVEERHELRPPVPLGHLVAPQPLRPRVCTRCALAVAATEERLGGLALVVGGRRVGVGGGLDVDVLEVGGGLGRRGDPAEVPVARARRALPEAAVCAAEGVDLAVGVVADADHALGQALLVGVEGCVAGRHGCWLGSNGIGGTWKGARLVKNQRASNQLVVERCK